MIEAENSLSSKLRGRLVGADSPSTVSARVRARRWDMFSAYFPDVSGMRVLDLGGTVSTWKNAPVRPVEVVLVNLKDQRENSLLDWMTAFVADACALPAEVRSQRFDLVYSNSVLEHLGGHARREAFAASVHDAAPRHWVQTPYRYFPIEPHWLFPAFQFLPVGVRAAVTRRWKVGNRRAPRRPLDAAVSSVLGIELLSKVEMQHYFPQSQIAYERFCGLVKSLIAVKTA